MHFRAPRRNLAITMLLTSISCNDERPDTTSDTDGTAGTAASPAGTTDADTAYGGDTAHGSGSQAEEADDTDGAPNDVRTR